MKEHMLNIILVMNISNYFKDNVCLDELELSPDECFGYFYFIFVVSAYDGGHPSRTFSSLVRVEVLDANDNPPIFTSGQYDSIVLTGIWDEFPVVVTDAYDMDSDDNGRVTYKISGNTTDLFSVDYKGVVSVTGLVDYDQLLDDGLLDGDDSLQFLVVATDNGYSPLLNQAIVNITIIDIESAGWFLVNYFTSK